MNQIVATVPLNNFDGEATFTIELDENSQPLWQLVADFSLFDAGHAFSFFPATQPDAEWTLRAARLPGKWKPDFTSLGNLPAPRFDPLKQCSAASNACDLKNGEEVGDLQSRNDDLVSPAAVLGQSCAAQTSSPC